MTGVLCSAFLIAAPALLADGVSFPVNLVPFSSVSYYVTASNSSGDQLVVGALTGGLNTISQFPVPDSSNQSFCDTAVQLAPGQFYPNVYIPTAQERMGNFRAFAGLLIDPVNSQPFPGGILRQFRLGNLYAFRIAATQVTSAVKGWSSTGSMSEGRTDHAAVLLPSGKVFVVGISDSAQLYDPATRTVAPPGGRWRFTEEKYRRPF